MEAALTQLLSSRSNRVESLAGSTHSKAEFRGSRVLLVTLFFGRFLMFFEILSPNVFSDWDELQFRALSSVYWMFCPKKISDRYALWFCSIWTKENRPAAAKTTPFQGDFLGFKTPKMPII